MIIISKPVYSLYRYIAQSYDFDNFDMALTIWKQLYGIK